MNCANLDMLFVSSVFKRNSDIFLSVFLPRKQAIPVNSDTSPFSIALSTTFSRDFFDKKGGYDLYLVNTKNGRMTSLSEYGINTPFEELWCDYLP
jgi:hypothetical protein